MRDLIADGNSVVLVDHDTQILKSADWLIEMGPTAGADGGKIISQGTVGELARNPNSQICPFIAPEAKQLIRKRCSKENLFDLGTIDLQTKSIHTVKPLRVKIPKGKLTVVTGVSGSGKTTLVLESLIPALNAAVNREKVPQHIKSISAPGITNIKLIDATPIGINIRSTVATYANVHDELRKIYAKMPAAKDALLKAGDFSYNTGKLRCPLCDGTGVISLDVQFLPDVEIPCPACKGSRYSDEAKKICSESHFKGHSLPELMSMDINHVLEIVSQEKTISQRLQILQNLGLGYLTLGEETPSLSGGEAQRLKLASEMGKPQSQTVFVFDEPTIGLHPLDVQVLMKVFDQLIHNQATVIVIEHDLDIIRNADYLIDMGPGGGDAGGRIVAMGTPEDIRSNPNSLTGRFL